jgi:hypothetical protein
MGRHRMRGRRAGRQHHAAADAWRWVGASVPGAGHRRSGTPCQDAFASRVRADGTLLLAVADGVSSVVHGGCGARVAVRAAVDALAGNHDVGEAAVQHAVMAARAALARRAARHAAPVSDFATTLLVVMLSPTGVLASAQVGDGAIVALDEQGHLTRVVAADTTTGYANVVRPVTDPHAPLRLGMATHVCAVGLVSDGLEAMAVADATPHAPFWLPLLRFATVQATTAQTQDALAAWLEGDSITAQTDDDCTLVLTWHRAVPRVLAAAECVA